MKLKLLKLLILTTMIEYQIIGESKPNKYRLKAIKAKKETELSKRRLKFLVDIGQIKVSNPELLNISI